MMRPPVLMWRTSLFVATNTPATLTAIIRSQSSNRKSSRGVHRHTGIVYEDVTARSLAFLKGLPAIAL